MVVSFRTGIISDTESWVGEKLVNKTSQQQTPLTLLASGPKGQGGVEGEAPCG